jgi:hypothetical protein
MTKQKERNMVKVFKVEKGNLTFQLASDGKTARFVVPDHNTVEVPTEVAELILYYTNLAAPDLKCLLDGKEPEDPFKRLVELEEVAKNQEEGLEALRTQSEEMNERLKTQGITIEDQDERIKTLMAELEVANIAATAARGKETPIHVDPPEPS